VSCVIWVWCIRRAWDMGVVCMSSICVWSRVSEVCRLPSLFGYSTNELEVPTMQKFQTCKKCTTSNLKHIAKKQVEKITWRIIFQISNINIIKLQQLMIHLSYSSFPYKTSKTIKNGGNPKKLKKSPKNNPYLQV
jgi:hypothetical protein